MFLSHIFGAVLHNLHNLVIQVMKGEYPLGNEEDENARKKMKGGRGGGNNKRSSGSDMMNSKEIALVEFGGEDCIYWQDVDEVHYDSVYDGEDDEEEEDNEDNEEEDEAEDDEDNYGEDGEERQPPRSGRNDKKLSPALETRRMFHVHAQRIYERVAMSLMGDTNAQLSKEELENGMKLLFPYLA
jgi:hypothetical protein